MAKSADDYIRSMQASVADVDSTIDTSKGPVLETAFIPWAPEFESLDVAVEHLGELYQFDNADLWTEDEIRFLGRQHGIEFGGGQFSQGFLTFWTTTRPTSNISIPIGTLAATDDSEYLFQTIEEALIYADAADLYFNASTRRYEITVSAQATSEGSDYDIRAGRVRLLLSTLTGIGGVVNNDDFTDGGGEDQNLDDFVAVIQELSLGNSLGTPGGVQGAILKIAYSLVTDVSVVTPADTTIFERYSDSGLRAAMDIYVLGRRLGIDTYSYTTVGSESKIYIPNVPLVAVSGVTVDGVAADYRVVIDQSGERRGSDRAEDYVLLTTVPGPGHSVFISYSYNQLISNLQSLAESLDLFDTSVLVRQGKPVPVTVEVQVDTLNTGLSASDIEAGIKDFFTNDEAAGGTAKFIGAANPEILKENLRVRLEEDLGLTIGRFIKFNRPDRAVSAVESIMLEKHEYAVPTITVRI